MTMNLAEYRRELKLAADDFREAVEHATTGYAKRVAAAEVAFFEDRSELKAVAEENVPARRCGF